MTGLRAMQAEWQTLGQGSAQLLDRGQMHDRVGSPGYVGGLYDPEGGHLHPLNYALGLAEACRSAGVIIHEQSPVVAVDSGPKPSLATAHGRVRANALVIAGNALLGRLVPGLERTIAPIGSYIAATEPLAPARIHQVLRDDVAVCGHEFHPELLPPDARRPAAVRRPGQLFRAAGAQPAPADAARDAEDVSAIGRRPL